MTWGKNISTDFSEGSKKQKGIVKKNTNSSSVITIVAVDDETDILTLIKKALQSNSFRIEIFSKPRSALEYIHRNNDGSRDRLLLISDVRMPGMNGFELTRSVKAFYPTIPIVIMTAFDIDKREFDKVMPSTSVDAFLTKPFDSGKLVTVVKTMTAKMVGSSTKKEERNK